MPIPYLGSKRKSAGRIYQTIKNFHPDSNLLVDVFCGGFAISEFFIKQGWRVIANDKNKYVIALLDQTINKGLDESVVTRWVSRTQFETVLKNPNKYDSWYVGYLMCIWSFGNNQQGYLFGRDTEPYKEAGHELVINRNQDLIKELIPGIPQRYIEGVIKQPDWHKRRIALNFVARKLKTRILELERLEQLERLQRLERLQQLEQLELYSMDYREVRTPRGAVIYCDPPYKDTGEYREGSFNHGEFWEWVSMKSNTNPIYISEYSAPKGFKSILKFDQSSTYAGGNNKNQPAERLFIKSI